jgi:uncharacterized protein YgbK (DUF1537 family)
VVIADDLTGATDTGAAFAQRGWSTGVALALDRLAHIPSLDALIVTTESRALPARAAATAVTQAAASLVSAGALRGAPWIYKKIDSTLRGHPAAELAALMQACRIDRALVAPAFPAQGRTTVGGRQLVNGAPLEETVFGREAASSDLRALFAAQTEGSPARLIALADVRRGAGHAARLLTAAGPAVWIGDAESEDDLRALVQAADACGIRLLCGSAGLARALATPAGAQRELEIGMIAPYRARPGAILVVAGSRHPATARQVAAAGDRGMAVVAPPAAFALDADAAGAISETSKRVAEHAVGGRPVVVATAGLPDCPGGAREMARRLGELAAAVVSGGPVAGLVLTGGDVAAAVCAALGGGLVRLRGEVQPGIAIGWLADGRCAGLALVTKAGGFGGEDALLAAAAAIQRLAES